MDIKVNVIETEQVEDVEFEQKIMSETEINEDQLKDVIDDQPRQEHIELPSR